MMNREKQIEEMAKELNFCKGIPYEICRTKVDCKHCLAEQFFSAGYRKQSEGEWKLHKDGSGTCSECHFIQKDIWDYDHYQHFCGHCGAKMKGGAE